MTKIAMFIPPAMQRIGFRVRGIRSVSLSILLLFSFGGWAGATPATTHYSLNISEGLFQQALDDDLSERPSEARKIYDALEGTEMAAKIAVPSAVNFAALGRFDEAKSAFAGIASSSHPRESSYAQLWQLWLTARTHTGKMPNLVQQLSEMAERLNMAIPYQQAIVDLYAGRGRVDDVFNAIDAMPNLSEVEKQNLITEATFFTGAYLRYVSQDRTAALQVFKRYQDQLYILSLERPLINEAIAELETAKHS